jgi:hypothetical protein
MEWRGEFEEMEASMRAYRAQVEALTAELAECRAALRVFVISADEHNALAKHVTHCRWRFSDALPAARRALPTAPGEAQAVDDPHGMNEPRKT